MPNAVQQNTSKAIKITALTSIVSAPEILVFNPATKSNIFPTLPLDLVLEPGNYHGGNPVMATGLKVKSCDNLNITVSKEKTFSPEKSRGLFDIQYPAPGTNVTGKVEYYWDNVFTTPLGIYAPTNVALTAQNPLNPQTKVWSIYVDKELIRIQTNDVNIVPREGDYIVFNETDSSFTYQNGGLNQRLPLFKGAELFQAKIIEVTIMGGANVGLLYSVKIDKSINLLSASRYAIVLLNRMNTSIQKELFYETFEQVEVHRKQLLGDPYNNTTNVNKPQGRKNHLYYNGHEALGMKTLLRNILQDKETPFVFFDVNDEIKDRFSYGANTYDTADLRPKDTHFEFHLPGIMINDNLYSLGTTAQGSNTPMDANGNIIENILVTDGNFLEELGGIGKYTGLYLKHDQLRQKRYGWVCFDLRIVVIDEPELATALGYNSNRNYTLPRPTLDYTKANNTPNKAQGVNLDIIDATPTTPIVIRTSMPHNLQRGAKVVIQNVKGNTAANGEWYVDTTGDAYKFTIWDQTPQYNPGGVQVPGTGSPVASNGAFVNNGAGNSGKVIQALPAFNYFFTYRVRDKHTGGTLPYAELTSFNFESGNTVDNKNGSLYFEIPPMYFANARQGGFPFGSFKNYGYKLDTSATDWGIDIIIGEYARNDKDPIAPYKIIGINNVMCIPVHELSQVPTGDHDLGIQVILNKKNDYDRAISDTKGLVKNYEYDILRNQKHYDYNVNTLSPTLLAGNGKWTLGEIIYRNRVEVNRAQFSIHIPADKWNGTKNPTYRPSENEFIREKYISEVAILLDDTTVQGDPYNEKPMIYAKIAPAVKKSNLLDINISLSCDF